MIAMLRDIAALIRHERATCAHRHVWDRAAALLEEVAALPEGEGCAHRRARALRIALTYMTAGRAEQVTA